jgi:phosphatidylinositol alpha 1,6-mannosyltransferase
MNGVCTPPYVCGRAYLFSAPRHPSRQRYVRNPTRARLQPFTGECQRAIMRIAIVAETFLPTVNGVTHSLQRILEHLAVRGHDVVVIAPYAGDVEDVGVAAGAVVVRLPSVPLAGYRSVRLAVGGVPRVRRILAEFAPDVVHLASPFELGWRAVRAARQLGIPTVAVYQTDVPAYVSRYGLPFLSNWAWQRVENIHREATRTLAPSTSAVTQLREHGVQRVRMWRRGVDTRRFLRAKEMPICVLVLRRTASTSSVMSADWPRKSRSKTSQS